MAFPEGIHGKNSRGKQIRRRVKDSDVTSPEERSLGGRSRPVTFREKLRQHDKQSESAAKPNTTRFGLSQRGSSSYPEAFEPVDIKFWRGLSREQQQAVNRLQAVAQEKVGFESGSEKFFIEDFDPKDQKSARTEKDISLLQFNTPRLVSAGFMFGAATAIAVMVPVGVLGVRLLIFSAVLAVIGLLFFAGRN